MANFTRLAATAKRLIDKNGRDVTFLKYASDSGPRPAADIRNNPSDTLGPIKGVFVELESATELGIETLHEDLVKVTEKVLMMSGVDAGTKNMRGFDEIVDEGQHWKIKFVRELRPASVTLLYFMGVGR